jgi:hypothetical protein
MPDPPGPQWGHLSLPISALFRHSFFLGFSFLRIELACSKLFNAISACTAYRGFIHLRLTYLAGVSVAYPLSKDPRP